MSEDIRPATAADGEACIEIMYLDPEPELVAVCQDIGLARCLGRVLVERGVHVRPERTLVLESAGKPHALMEMWYPGESLAMFPTAYARVLYEGVRLGGPSLLARYFRFQRARARVDSPHPPDSLYIAHLNTHPEHRGQGLGERLLEHAETLARRRLLPELSLDVYIGNPARRLYERFGFETTAEKRDPAFERITGLSGYASMVKDLR